MSLFLSSPNPVTKMKNSFYLLSLAGLLSLGACEFKDSVNTDPNNPRDVSSPATLLTSSQVGFAYTYGGAYARYTSIFTNQLSGLDRQAISIDNFNFLTSETDDAWDNSYRILRNLDAVIEKSSGSPHYTGVAKIMKALILGTVAENYGASPYRTALKAKEDGSGLQPTYDSGPQNYQDIQSLLSEGIAEVNASESILSPGQNDNMFEGSMPAWAKFAYVLKARYFLHTGEVIASDRDSALAYATLGLGQDGAIKFEGSSVGSQNPFYQYEDQRGDLGPGKIFVDTLVAFADPRGPLFIDDVTLGGSTPGQADGGAYPIPNPDDPVYFVNSAEAYFIAAEVQFSKGQLDAAASNHNLGVAASLTERGITDASTYIANHGSETGTTITLNKIMVQKWLAQYLNPEAFADWRRTGIPATLVPPDNITGGAFVRKFPYPQKERTLNGANLPTYEPNPPQIGRVWWDVP